MIDRFNFFENNLIFRESGNRKVKVGGGFLSIKGRGIVRIYFNIFKVRFINTVVGWLVAAPLFFTSFLMPRALAYLDSYIPEYERAF